jgi:hypothetical protein
LKTIRKRRRNIDRDLEQWIINQARLERTPTEIYQQMLKEPQFKDRENLPLSKTIERVVNDVKVMDTTALWTIGSIKVDVGNICLEDARLLLDILRTVFIVTKGRKRSFTIKEAEVVLKIAKLEPGSSHLDVWGDAQNYIYYESKGINMQDLDLSIMFNTPGSLVNWRVWHLATEMGWFKPEYPDELPSMELSFTMNDSNLIEYLSRDLHDPRYPSIKPKDIADFLGESEINMKEKIDAIHQYNNEHRPGIGMIGYSIEDKDEKAGGTK